MMGGVWVVGKQFLWDNRITRLGAQTRLNFQLCLDGARSLSDCALAHTHPVHPAYYRSVSANRKRMTINFMPSNLDFIIARTHPHTQKHTHTH